MAHENATPRRWAHEPFANQIYTCHGAVVVADVEKEADALLIIEAVNAYDTLRAENERLRAENAKLSELTETQAEKLSGCPFDRDGYELDLDVPCPVCGGLGHPDSPDACLYPTKSMRAARPALSEAQP